jgi:predicted phosphoadenosine phosphosulfate sulfurtransferase
MKKKNLLVSFSGGETSAFMSQWLKNHYKKLGYENIVFVFANTGIERNETLEFAEKCDSKFGLNLWWVESSIYLNERKGSSFTITDFEHATRNTHWKFRDNTPFEMLIRKYGIPNKAFPHCTRELKQAPINAFGKVYFNGEKYDTAIGIRIDEIDRMNAKAKEKRFVYPLIDRTMIPYSKPMVNFYWQSMPFRLELKGYEGNCAACWKKSDNKLYQIAKENNEYFDFMIEMERKYPRVGHEFKKDVNSRDRTFFRRHRSALQIIEESKSFNGKIKNDSDVYNYQLDLLDGDESCEVFSECGS